MKSKLLVEKTMDYSRVPIVDPPAGVSSNFIDPQSRAPIFVALGGSFLALMLIVVFMRLWVKLVVLRASSWEDGELFPFHGDVIA